MEKKEHSALQLLITLYSTLLLIERLFLFTYNFPENGCSDFLLLGIALSYIVQLLVIKLLKAAIRGKRVIAFLWVLTVAGITACIVPPIVVLSRVDFKSSKHSEFCDLATRLAIGITQIIGGIPVVVLSWVCACRKLDKNKQIPSEKKINFMFMRCLFQSMNEICLFMLVMAFLNNLYWGSVLLLSISVSIIIWVSFSYTVQRKKLTSIKVEIERAYNWDPPDSCLIFFCIFSLLMGPLYFFFMGSLTLVQLWELEDNEPEQYYYVNINFLLKLLFLPPTGLLYLAYAIIQEREVIFFYAFLAYWVLSLGIIGLPMLYNAKKYGCKKKVILSTPNNSLFTREEVKNYEQNEISKILPKQENQL